MPSPGRPLGPLALTGGKVDRAGHRRGDDAWLAATLADPSSLVVAVSRGRLPMDDAGLRWRPVADVTLDAELYYLGRTDDGVERFATRVAEPGEDWPTLRDRAADLDDLDGSLAAAAVALANWHRTHRHCPRCGAPTHVENAGWTRRCAADESEHYPRTDPAVIMAVISHDDRILLGHNPSWPENRFSTLAGFVEPGESIEDAVRREVLEEVGVTVGEVTYLASQPWPFPASLMIGCEARALDLEITVDPVEMSQAQWFTRDEFAEAVHAGRLFFPRTTSISRRLIERWFGGELPRQHDAAW